MLPVLLYDLAKYSNRFAGPVYRLQRNLNALAEGQSVAPMSFRENDYWQALAESFNKVASRLAAAEQAAANRHEDDFQPCLAADFQDSLAN